MRLGASAFLILLFFAVMQLFVLPPDGFMTGDQGAKYLQTRAFAEQGPLNPAIDVKARDIDPEYRYQEPQLARSRERLVSVFMWLLPLLGAPFLALFGMRGLYVVPAVSAVVVFFCAARLARRPEDPDGAIAGLLVLLVTPIALYGLELWEHAPAAACVAIAAVLLLPADEGRAFGLRPGRMRFFAAGVAVICGYLFREEAAVTLPALLLGRALSRDRDRLRDLITAGVWSGLGALAALAASTPMNVTVYGTPLPMHLTEEALKSARTSSYLSVRHDIVPTLFMPLESRLLWAVVLIAGLSASSYAFRRGTASRGALTTVHAAVFVMLAVGVGLPLWHLARGEAQSDAYNVASAAHTWVFAIALLYLPWLVAPGRRQIAKYLIVSGVLALLFTSLVVPSTAGAQWSPRYFLQITPLLAIPAAEIAWSRTTQTVAAWAARATLAASLVMLIAGVAYLAGAKTRFASVTHGLARLTAPGEIVITDVFWLPEVAATLAPSRRMLFSWNLSDAPLMVSPAVKAGFGRFTIVTYPLLTNHISPDAVDVPGAHCLFVRSEHQYGVEIPGVVLSRYSCASP